MATIFKREIENLKEKILSLSAMVEVSVWRAVKALEERDAKEAEKIIQSDMEIDQMEVDVEEECLKILALHQPVAVDLRFIVAVLKINNDLERIGDYSVNIAERAKYLALGERLDIAFDFSGMAEKVQSMLKKCMHALVNMDAGLAFEVLGADDEVDALNREMYQQVKKDIPNHLDRLDYLVHLLSVSRQLEHIADLATNIAWDVIYMVKGEIGRHKAEDHSLKASDKN